MDRLRELGFTIILPEATTFFASQNMGPSLRSDQQTYWYDTRPDTVRVNIAADMMADPAPHYHEQGTPGQPDTYGPHWKEPIGAAITGKRLVAQRVVAAIAGAVRSGRYVRPS
jgi:hypothetical protein